MSDEVVSINRICAEAKKAARANIEPHAACNFGYGSPAARLFLIEYSKELKRMHDEAEERRQSALQQ